MDKRLLKKRIQDIQHLSRQMVEISDALNSKVDEFAYYSKDEWTLIRSSVNLNIKAHIFKNIVDKL